MVFQSYAIWPHMTVFENVAYPLRVRRIGHQQVRRAVEHTLAQVGLESFADRPATTLSGGQQQRVAFARCLVFEPSIVLLDEPFSNLDAKLREHMRAELKVLQRRLGLTVVMVTHDQIEALSVSDRIVVMERGRVEQIGTPQELYRQPKTSGVRDFLGRTILLQAIVSGFSAPGATVSLVDGTSLVCSGNYPSDLSVGESVFVAVRPEVVDAANETVPGGQANVISGEILALLFLGDRYEASVRLAWDQVVLFLLPADDRWREGQRVSLVLPPDGLHLWRG
jgi:iron(III) transport system ATP-binding protein